MSNDMRTKTKLRARTKVKFILANCNKYNSIVTVEEKLSVNLMKFRKIVIDHGNL